MPLLKIKPKPNLKPILVSNPRFPEKLKTDVPGPSSTGLFQCSLSMKSMKQDGSCLDDAGEIGLPDNSVHIESNQENKVVHPSIYDIKVEDKIPANDSNQDIQTKKRKKETINMKPKHSQAVSISKKKKYHQNPRHQLTIGHRKIKPSLSNRPVSKKEICNSISKKSKSEKSENVDLLNNNVKDIPTRDVSVLGLEKLKSEVDLLSKMYCEKYKDLTKTLTDVAAQNGDGMEVLVGPQENSRKPDQVIKVYLNCWPVEWTKIPTSSSTVPSSDTRVVLLKSVQDEVESKLQTPDSGKTISVSSPMKTEEEPNTSETCCCEDNDLINLPHQVKNTSLFKRKYTREALKLLSKPVPKVIGDKSKSITSSQEANPVYALKPKGKMISSYGKMSREAKQNFHEKFGSGPPDIGKLKMRDLIFYNPTSNPMSKDSDEKILATSAEQVDNADIGNEEEVDDVSAVPQLKVGPDGQIIIDPKSMPINSKTVKNGDNVVKSCDHTIAETSDKPLSTELKKNWSHDETVKFYRALHNIGADFSMMGKVFPDRSRKNLKFKFKKEEKLNGPLIDKVLAQHADFDIDALLKELEQDKKKAEQNKKKKEQKKLSRPKKERNRDFCFAERTNFPRPNNTGVKRVINELPLQKILFEQSMDLLMTSSAALGRNSEDQTTGKTRVKTAIYKNYNKGVRTSKKTTIKSPIGEPGKASPNHQEVSEEDLSTHSVTMNSASCSYHGDTIDELVIGSSSKKGIKRRFVNVGKVYKNMSSDGPNQVRNLQSIIADNAIEEITDCDGSPPSKKDNIVINTNIEYDSINITNHICYDFMNFSSPVDVNITINHQPDPKSDSLNEEK